jgi:hypothetical protein
VNLLYSWSVSQQFKILIFWVAHHLEVLINIGIAEVCCLLLQGWNGMRMKASYIGRVMWICHPKLWDRERVQRLVQESKIAEGEIILKIALSRPPCSDQAGVTSGGS